MVAFQNCCRFHRSSWMCAAFAAPPNQKRGSSPRRRETRAHEVKMKHQMCSFSRWSSWATYMLQRDWGHLPSLVRLERFASRSFTSKERHPHKAVHRVDDAAAGTPGSAETGASAVLVGLPRAGGLTGTVGLITWRTVGFFNRWCFGTKHVR